MIIPYWLMYRLGFTPWERPPIPEPFRRLIEGPDRLPPGRALDIGCGTGADAVYLAKLGWQVTGVDLVGRALERAKARAARERVDVQWIEGDVGKLGHLDLEPGYALLYDFGCFHGLPDAARVGGAAGVTRLAAPHASLLIVAFSRNQRLVQAARHGQKRHRRIVWTGLAIRQRPAADLCRHAFSSASGPSDVVSARAHPSRR